MGKSVIHLGRIALGLAAEIASRVPSLEKRFLIGARLHGPFPKGPFLWMHGASMGECKMLLNLARALQNDVPHLPKILITSQKPEVVQHLRNTLARGAAAEPACGKPDGTEPACGKLEVALAPADVAWTLKKFLRRVQPVGLILGENELWPGYLSSVKRFTKKPAVALVSGRFQKAVPGMDFSGLGFAAMQTFADQARFLEAASRSFRGSIHEGGDWKLLDWARGEESNSKQAAVLTSFISVHIEELPFLRKLFSRLAVQNKTIVLTPRRLEEIPQFIAAFRRQNIPVVQWPATAPGHVSLVHTFGKVQEILSRSESAYVGGSFHKSLGIHDFWEPLQMGVPTFVGPYCRGHEGAVDVLVRDGALVRVPNSSSLSQTPANRACVVSSLSKEREKILNSYALLKKYVEELLK